MSTCKTLNASPNLPVESHCVYRLESMTHFTFHSVLPSPLTPLIKLSYPPTLPVRSSVVHLVLTSRQSPHLLHRGNQHRGCNQLEPTHGQLRGCQSPELPRRQLQGCLILDQGCQHEPPIRGQLRGCRAKSLNLWRRGQGQQNWQPARSAAVQLATHAPRQQMCSKRLFMLLAILTAALARQNVWRGGGTQRPCFQQRWQ